MRIGPVAPPLDEVPPPPAAEPGGNGEPRDHPPPARPAGGGDIAPGTDGPARRGGVAGRVRTHLSQPLHRNAYALVINTGLTGGLGLVFWVYAARRYDDVTVGENAALISAIMMLSTFAQVDGAAVLTRFLPRIRSSAARWVVGSYAISAVVGIVISVAYVVIAPRVSDRYAFLDDRSVLVALCGSVLVWNVFALGDGISTGLRHATLVPAYNAVYAVAKISLLVGFSFVLPQWGIVAAWMVPLALIVPAVNALFFLRYLPAHSRTPPGVSRVDRRRLLRYLRLDYPGALCGALTSTLLPVLVMGLLGASANARFYLAWTLTLALESVAFSLGSSLIVEGSFEPAKLAHYGRLVARRTAVLLLPAVLAVALLAPLLLSLFGSRYAAEGATVLRLLALGVLFRSVLTVWSSLARVTGDVGRVLIVVLSATVLLLVGVVAGAAAAGLQGVAAAYTVTYGVVAAGLVLPLRGRLRAGAEVPASELPAAGAGDAPRSAAGTGSAPTRRRRGFRMLDAGAAGRLLGTAAPLILLVAGAASLRSTDLAEIGGYGLVQALPPLTFVVLAALLASFLFVLWSDPRRSVSLGLHVVVLICLLYGAGPFVEREPRLGTTWLHAGFVDQIATHGATLADTDARYSWPGFFSAVAMLLEPAGLADARPLLLWAPVVQELLYLGPLLLLAYGIVRDLRLRWYAIFLFYVVNWVGQDYFSPQGLNIFLLLVILAVAVTWLRREPTRSSVRMVRRFQHRLLRRFATVSEPGSPVALVLISVAIGSAMIVSHQLTPVALLVDLGALALVGRLSARGLPMALAAVFVVHVSFFATDFWVGHLHDLFSGGGASVSQNVGSRFDGDQAHLRVLSVRLVLTGLVWLLALAGATRLLVRRQLPLPAVVLAAVALPIPFAQAYGGEALLRSYLYTLPFMCILAAGLFFAGRPRLRNVVAAGLVTLLLGGLALVSRYGNEEFERIRPDEVAAMEWLYGHAPAGSSFVAVIDALPWKYEVALGDEHTAVHGRVDDPRTVLAALRKAKGRNRYLILTAGQEAYGVANDGLPPGWLVRLRTTLLRTRQLRVVYANEDATILQWTAQARASS